MAERITWDADGAAYIRTRSARRPGALDIEPEWTDEALADDDLIALEPDPRSRIRAARYIGRSESAGRVLAVIAYRDLDGALHGVNAWPATGSDLADYERNQR